MASADICLLGSAMTDLVVRVSRLPEPGETLSGSSFSQGFGGKGANQAVMAARLGARVGAIIRLGQDAYGTAILENFGQEGIDTTFTVQLAGETTGIALITVEEESGQNVIVIVPGANSTLREADVAEAADLVKGSKVLVAQLETPLSATLAAFRLAREAGTLTLLNPAPAAALPEELLTLTDLLIPNEVEAGMLAGFPVRNHEDAERAAGMLLGRGPKTVILTLGKRGALIAEKGKAPLHVEAEAVQAVDTTGAGDAFVGSLAYFLACRNDLSLSEAVKRAGRVASLSVQREGAQSSFPMRDEVAAWLG